MLTFLESSRPESILFLEYAPHFQVRLSILFVLSDAAI